MGRLRTRFSFLGLIAITAIFLSLIYQILVDRFNFSTIYISWFPSLLCLSLTIVTAVAAVWAYLRLQLLPKIREAEVRKYQKHRDSTSNPEIENYPKLKEKLQKSNFMRNPIPAEVGFWLVCLAKAELMAAAFFIGGYGTIVFISIPGYLNKIPAPTLRVFQGSSAVLTALFLGIAAYLLEGFCILPPPKEKDISEAQIA